MSASIVRYIAFAELIVELAIAAAICYPAVLNWYQVSDVVNLVIRALLFLVTLLIWIFLPKGDYCPSKSVQQRGSSVMRSYSSYFMIAAAANAVLLAGWISHVVKYHSYSPLSYTTNLEPFMVGVLLQLLGVVVGLALLLFAIYDMRHSHLMRVLSART